MRPRLRARRLRLLSAALVFTVSSDDDGARVDQLVANHCGCSRAEAQRLLARGAVNIDGRRARKGDHANAGARIELRELPPRPDELRPQPAPEQPLTLLHVDAALVAMVKPPGQPTHPLRAGETGTLANALVARFPECAHVADDAREGGVAHRLDIDTSGVVLAARTRDAWLALRRAFAGGAVDKEYWALVAGQPPDHGVIDAPLVTAGSRARVATAGEAQARAALTRFQVLARGHEVALVQATSSTGRLHQIRAHLAHLGHPLLGDLVYGGPPAPAGTRGHFLHAARIVFPHPSSGAREQLSAPLPSERAAALVTLVGWAPRA